MSVFASGRFWLATGERAVKTAAQSAIAFLGAEVTGILDVDFGQAASVVGLATVLSVLSSIASAGVGNSGPSVASEELAPKA
jgi:hypothetical protein